MFDSLHQRRRYWPSDGGGGVGGDTIKLSLPLSHLTKRNVISAHKRLPPMRNSCKVL